MKYNIGMYGGAFNPLHLGHVNDIIKASNVCKKLYLVLSVSNDKNEIDYKYFIKNKKINIKSTFFYNYFSL